LEISRRVGKSQKARRLAAKSAVKAFTAYITEVSRGGAVECASVRVISMALHISGWADAGAFRISENVDCTLLSSSFGDMGKTPMMSNGMCHSPLCRS
jgi:hypothetical protein